MQVAADKLKTQGLSADEVKVELQRMSDGQLHMMPGPRSDPGRRPAWTEHRPHASSCACGRSCSKVY